MIAATAGAGSGATAAVKGAQTGATTAVKGVEIAAKTAKIAQAGANAAKAGTKIVKITSTIPPGELTNIKSFVKAGIKAKQAELTDKAASDMTDRLINSGINGIPMDWAALDPTGVAAVIQAFNKPICGK